MTDIVKHLTPTQLAETLRNNYCYLKPGILVTHTFPNRVMNDIAHILLKLTNRDSNGLKVHINYQLPRMLEKQVGEAGYDLIALEPRCSEKLLERNILFRPIILDKILFHTTIQKAMRCIPYARDIYFSDIFPISEKPEGEVAGRK